jgi:RNA polymerase sigma factor (sigma-70 family)
MEAVRRIDPAREARLLTYASYRIMARMKRATVLHGRHTVYSLDEPIDHDEGDGETVLDRIPDPGQSAEATASHRDIGRFVEELGPRQKAVIMERYWRDRTPTEVALSMGISDDRVRQIERKALFTLKWQMRDEGYHG